MGVNAAQFFDIVRGKIDHQQTAIGCQNPCGLGDRPFGMLGIVQHLVKQDGIKAVIGEGEGVEVAQYEFGVRLHHRSILHPTQLGTGEPQHLDVVVECNKAFGVAGEQFDHATGAGADIEHPANRRFTQQHAHCRFHLGLGDVERPDLIPLFGMGIKIGSSHFGSC